MRRAAYGAVSVVLIGAGAFSVAAPAQAAAPWWHLTAGTRPTYIDPAHGKPAVPAVPGEPEVQVVKIPMVEFEEPESADVNLKIGGTSIEPNGFCTPESLNQEFCGGALLTAANVEHKLEGPYGAGKVHVSETRSSESIQLTVESSAGVGSLEAQEFLGLTAQPTVEITNPGTPGTPEVPAVPDGEVYFTATNLGDESVSGKTSPVELTDVLPEGLEAVAIDATLPEQEADFLKRVQIPCKLATLTCTLEQNELGNNKTSLDLLAPFDELEVRIAVNVKAGAESGEMNEVGVSGGEGFSCANVGPGNGSYGDTGCTSEDILGNAFERTYTGPVPPASLRRPITISAAPVPFGVETYEHQNEEEGGGPDLRAASHPFQQTTTIVLNQGPDTSPPGSGGNGRHINPVALPKDIHFAWPPGLLGNPTSLATCTDAQFFGGAETTVANLCPPSSAIGVASVLVNEPTTAGVANITVPLFNLEPHYGEPARFGFNVTQGNAPVVIDVSLRSDGDYGATVETDNIVQAAALLSTTVTVWGSPGDPAHNLQRGWGCLLESRGDQPTEIPSCASTETREGAGQTQPPFLFLPTSCAGPAPDNVLGDTWVDRLDPADFPQLAANTMPQLEACNQVPFGPQIHSEPTSDAATSPTGLGFDITVDDEGQRNPHGLVQSQIKKTVVTLPEGFTANPAVAEGLKACSEAEYHASTLEAGTGCTEESKIGEVEIESPLVKPVLRGSLFVARQGENPSRNAQHPNGNLLTIYLVAKNPEIGVMVKQALKVTPNPVTGQLVTEADEIPQLPFSRFHLFFRSGQRSPLITPPACGTYTVGADLYPYSNPEAALHRESSFKITSGPEGQGCPSGGVPPFHPTLEAGTLNNSAGTYSPFVTHITRKDSEQEITRFSIKLPTGLLAKLKGVSECSDAAIAAAKAREKEGGAAEEEAHPSCPASSEVGHTLVGTGVGNVLAYAGGKLYLAGPYHGSPISLVSVTGAKVGPFDLGTVVVRFALDVNHETAEVSVDGANSDPIPHIVDGIPIHLRDIRAYVSRPGFTLNPTSCAKKSTAATILGSGASFTSSADDVPVTVSSPFQAADCASLGFKPKLALSLTGKKTHRGALPAFKAVLTYPKYGNNANIAKAQVTLPGSEFLEQGHLKNVCTRKVFETGANPGENCPKNSIYGKARATTPLLEAPLEGPVYLRTGYGTRLPELAAALNGPQISITLAGKIDSVHKKGVEGSRIRNSFEMVPDAPVEKFTLELKGGKKGLLVNSTDVCKGTHKALAAFTGQNGKLDEYEPALKAQCGKGGKKKSGKKKSGGKGKGGK